MGLTSKLAVFNGTVLGTLFGLTIYTYLADPNGIEFFVEAYGVTVFAFAAAASGNVLAFVKVFPTAPVIAGSVSGVIGGVLAWAIPTYMSVQISIPTAAIGGFVAALVMSLMMRFLPGL